MACNEPDCRCGDLPDQYANRGGDPNNLFEPTVGGFPLPGDWNYHDNDSVWQGNISDPYWHERQRVQFPQWPPVREPEFWPTLPTVPSLVPHVCPVCSGRGVVQTGFYDVNRSVANGVVDKEAWLGDKGEQCRSCNGRGIVFI